MSFQWIRYAHSPDGEGYEEFWENEGRAMGQSGLGLFEAEAPSLAGPCLKCGINLDASCESFTREAHGCTCYPVCQLGLPPLFRRRAASGGR